MLKETEQNRKKLLVSKSKHVMYTHMYVRVPRHMHGDTCRASL